MKRQKFPRIVTTAAAVAAGMMAVPGVALADKTAPNPPVTSHSKHKATDKNVDAADAYIRGRSQATTKEGPVIKKTRSGEKVHVDPKTGDIVHPK